MIRLVKKKLKSTRGDSIAEVLVALLISAVALVMLASMIMTSSRLITSSKTLMKDYYDASQALVTLKAGESQVTPDTLTIRNKEDNSEVALSSKKNIQYAVNNKVRNIPVVSYIAAD